VGPPFSSYTTGDIRCFHLRSFSASPQIARTIAGSGSQLPRMRTVFRDLTKWVPMTFLRGLGFLRGLEVLPSR